MQVNKKTFHEILNILLEWVREMRVSVITRHLLNKVFLLFFSQNFDKFDDQFAVHTFEKSSNVA